MPSGILGEALMKWPCLIDKRACKTPIELTLEQEGLNEYGEPLATYTYNGVCNYQDIARTTYTTDKKVVEISGRCYFVGDICEELPAISGGSAIIYGVRRDIVSARKARNPDGSVNYTEVNLR